MDGEGIGKPTVEARSRLLCFERTSHEASGRLGTLPPSFVPPKPFPQSASPQPANRSLTTGANQRLPHNVVSYPPRKNAPVSGTYPTIPFA